MDLIAKQFGLNLHHLVAAQQTHGNGVARVSMKNMGKTIPEADALITNEPGLALLVRTADCAPIFIYDPVKGAIGLVHAGWKGTVMNITGKTLRIMRQEFSSRPEDIKIWIGPSIKSCCYDCDLVEMNLWQAYESGIPQKNIEVSTQCTCCERDLFFSYRREGPGTGRLFSLVTIPI